MIKSVEIIVIIALLIFSFFLGVKYSDSVKNQMSWLKTQDEQEVELPDLSNENSETLGIDPEINAAVPAENFDNNPENANLDNTGEPLNPSVAPVAVENPAPANPNVAKPKP